MAELDRLTFLKRLCKFYDFFNNKENNIDGVYVIVGEDGDSSYSKSIAIQTWFFDKVLRDTLIVLCPELVVFMASPRKLEFLKQSEKGKENRPEGIMFRFFERKKQDDDETMMKEVASLIPSSSSNVPRVGVLGKDKSTGTFADKWRSIVASFKFQKVDISAGISDMMSVKDEMEIARVKRAAELTTRLFLKYLKGKVVDIVDAEQKVRHSRLTTLLNEALNNRKFISQDDSEVTEFCYPPIFQSGDGRYALKYSSTSDDHIMHFGAVICMFGVRYKSYCSNVGRTFLIFPTNEMEENYSYLLSVEEKLVDQLRDGVEMCHLHKTVHEFAERENPSLAKRLIPIFGFLSGIEFKDSVMVVSPKCKLVAKKGMVFQIHVGLSDIPNPNGKSKESKSYSLFLADTVLVEDAGSPATVLTTASKRVNTVSVRLRDDEDENMSEVSADADVPKLKDSSDGVTMDETGISGERKLRRPTALMQSKTRKEQNSEQKRLEHQKLLSKKLHESAMTRLMNTSGKHSPEKVRKWNVSYKHASVFPTDPAIGEMKIFVDKRSETVIMPVYGSPCPFHISTIKNVSLTVEGDYTYLRINFFHPGSAVVRSNEQQYSDPNAIFVKEFTYRASNIKTPGAVAAPSTNLHTAFRLIKDVQKHYKEQEAEKRELEGVVKQDALVISLNKNIPRLKDLCVRPNITQKRITGTLEAHTNGVRYTTIRGEHIDILFSNVKHAFYQPCDNEMIILLHFHLNHPIIFGKKKQTDIQFYAEVGELATDLNKNKSRPDKDDIASEQAERDYRQKLKTIFRTFIERLEASAPKAITFETPFRDLGFYGTPFRSMVLLVPTSSCLVNLTEWPPFVVSLEEVELVHFERVHFHLQNFDMVFIFKDYSKKVAMVNSIPMNQLDAVKEWINSCDIKYTEGIQSLNWAKVMKAITDDLEGFFESGGWNFLEPESDEDASGREAAEEEEDDVYIPSEGSEVDEESSESDYEESEEDESSSGSERGVSDEDGESGKSWSELEEEARRDDMEKGESEEERPTKKTRRGGVGHSSSSMKKKRRIG